MANIFYPEPTNGGDSGVWGLKELRQNRVMLGVNTCQLYDDSGTLKLSVGNIGINNGSTKGIVLVDTITTISLASINNSKWAYIRLKVSGSTPAFDAVEINSSNYWELPSTFTSAFDRTKGGYYVAANERCIGVIWKSSAGALKGVVNAGSIIDSYAGYSTCPTTSFVYHFEKSLYNTYDSDYAGKVYDVPYANRSDNTLVTSSVNTAGVWSNAVTALNIPQGTKGIYCQVSISIGAGTNILCVEKASGVTLVDITTGTNWRKYARVGNDISGLVHGNMIWIPLDSSMQFKWCPYVTNTTVYISYPNKFLI